MISHTNPKVVCACKHFVTVSPTSSFLESNDRVPVLVQTAPLEDFYISGLISLEEVQISCSPQFASEYLANLDNLQESSPVICKPK